MKYSIFSLMFLISLSACSERPQMEEDSRASYSDFFMSRADKAKSIKDQNFSVHPVPEAGPVLQQAEQREEEDGVMEAIKPQGEDDYFYYDRDRQEVPQSQELEDADSYSEEDKEIQREEAPAPLPLKEKKMKLYTPGEVRLWK